MSSRSLLYSLQLPSNQMKGIKKMNIDDILQLAKAGFTKDEIMQLASSFTGKTNDPQDQAEAEEKPIERKPEPQPSPEPVKTPEPELGPVEPKEDKRIDDILAKLQVVSDKIQQNAILGTRQPERESTDDILAKIINPTYKKE